MVLNGHMHICGACDGSERSHAYFVVHVMVLNHIIDVTTNTINTLLMTNSVYITLHNWLHYVIDATTKTINIDWLSLSNTTKLTSLWTMTYIFGLHVMVLNDHMHIYGACDGSERSHAYLWCMWWFWTVTCIFVVHLVLTVASSQFLNLNW